jgi:hypothetical protein
MVSVPVINVDLGEPAYYGETELADLGMSAYGAPAWELDMRFSAPKAAKHAKATLQIQKLKSQAIQDIQMIPVFTAAVQDYNMQTIDSAITRLKENRRILLQILGKGRTIEDVPVAMPVPFQGYHTGPYQPGGASEYSFVNQGGRMVPSSPAVPPPPRLVNQGGRMVPSSPAVPPPPDSFASTRRMETAPKKSLPVPPPRPQKRNTEQTIPSPIRQEPAQQFATRRQDTPTLTPTGGRRVYRSASFSGAIQSALSMNEPLTT